ncbi:MAG: molecular chaperone DnaJ, partial [Rhodospirillales bacterium]|nr:molecular chaperone DnaJ [Rhodospirillales bacterium]
MLYLLLGLALLGSGLSIAYWFSKADPKQIVGTLKVLVILVSAALTLALVVAGRAQFLLALPILAGLAWKLWPLFGSLGQRLSGGGTSDSRVRTRFFKMTLDHGSGHVDGEILQGVFAGRQLSDLNLAELQALRGDVAGDP